LKVANGPLDAAIDPQSGRLVVAMGPNGVLSRAPSGEWAWIAVDICDIVASDRWAIMPAKLSTEFWLSLILLLLTPATIIPFRGERSQSRTIGLVVSWGCWILSSTILLQLSQDSDFFALSLFLTMPVATLLAAVVLLGDMRLSLLALLRGIGRHILLTTLAAPLLYLLPLTMWVQGVIPSYTLAWGGALFLLGVSLLMAYVLLDRRLRQQE
jgi:hypothetical protein